MRLLRGISTLAQVAVVVLVISGSVAAQELWQGVYSGMTPQEVRKVHNDAFEPEQPEELGNGAIELLRTPIFDVGSHRALARFFFIENKIDQVKLNFIVKDKNHANYIFDEIETMLITKYGDPIKNETMMVGRKSEWILKGGVNIRIIVITLNDPLLNVVYQTTVRDMQEKS